LIGKLIYFSHTRPNIAYVAGAVSQFMHNPKEARLKIVYRILQYLKATSGRGILFTLGNEMILEAYANIDYAGSIDDLRAMAIGICEILWLKMILEFLKIDWKKPIRLYSDNKSRINIVHKLVQHDKTKHVEVDKHFIKEKLDNCTICTSFKEKLDNCTICTSFVTAEFNLQMY